MLTAYPHDHTPEESTGVLVIDPTDGGYMVRIAEYSVRFGWDVPPKPGEVYILEKDVLNTIQSST